MRTITTLIAAAAFVLHLTLGCCAHHAHAVEGAVGSEHASTVDHHHGGNGHGCKSHRHSGLNHDSQPPADGPPVDEDCPGHDCNAGHCVFMAAGKTVITKDIYLAVLPLFVAAPLTHVSISPRISATIDSGGLIAPPVRTHLFNQVLLI